MAASVPNKFVGTTTQDVSNLDANFDALVNFLNSGVDFQGAELVSSYAAIRALTASTTSTTLAFTTGRLAMGDGGMGWFRADPSDTTSADTDGTILVAADGMRWKRLFEGAFHASWFGIFPDGTDYSVQMQALADLISTGPLVGTILLKVTAVGAPYVMQWNHKSGVMYEGVAQQSAFLGNGQNLPATTIQVPPAGGNILSQAGGDVLLGGGFRWIRLKGQGATVPASGIILGNGASSDTCSGFMIDQMEVEDFADSGVIFGPYCKNYHVTNYFSDNCVMNHSALTAPTYCADFRGGDGTILQNIEVAASGTALTSANKYFRAIHLGGPESNNFRADNILAEWGDVALVVEGALHYFGKIRAEFAFAEGLISLDVGSTYGEIAGNNNSRAGAGLYDSLSWQGRSCTISRERAIYDGAHVAAKYGSNDIVASSQPNIHLGLTGNSMTLGLAPPASEGIYQTVDAPPYGFSAINIATPRVDGWGCLRNYFNTANTVATTITNLLGTVNGGIYRIRCQDTFTTVQQTVAANTGFYLPGAVDLLLSAGTTYTFISRAGVLYLIGTS